MLEFQGVWDGLDADRRANDSNAFLVRLVGSDAGIRVFLGTESENRRLLLLRLGEKWTEEMIDGLPKWNGLLIEQRYLGLLDEKHHWFLMLSNTSPDYKFVFQEVVSAVCRDLLKVEKEDWLHQSLKNILLRWQSFFHKNGFDGLTRSEQRGLFGELWVLREMLSLKRETSISAIEAWKGPDKSFHDFVAQGHSIEVKTTTAQKHHAFKVAGERQLDDSGLQSLSLIFLVFSTLDGSGETLPKLIESVRYLLSSEFSAMALFEKRLEDAGYLEAHARLYKSGYIHREVRCFHVTDGFPRILSRDIPDGTGDLSYSVQVSACAPFEANYTDAMSSFCRLL